MVDDGGKWGQYGAPWGKQVPHDAFVAMQPFGERVSGSRVFVGVYERQLDERGRVALPSAFRSTIGEQCYLTFGDDGCVRVMSAEAFHDEAQEMIDAVKAGTVSRAKQRAFASSVVVAGIDKQGRIVLDQRLRDHAAIRQQEPVQVLGALDRIEIWEPNRYAEQEAAGLEEL